MLLLPKAGGIPLRGRSIPGGVDEEEEEERIVQNVLLCVEAVPRSLLGIIKSYVDGEE